MIKLIKNSSGASAAEYARIVGVMGGAVVAGATAFGGSLKPRSPAMAPP
jgi:Flp pilus assembly pilin Flp